MFNCKVSNLKKDKKLGWGRKLFFANLLLTITLSTSSVLKLVWDSKTCKSELCFHPNHIEDQVSLHVQIYTPWIYVCIYTHTYLAYIHMCMCLYAYTHTHKMCENIEQIKLPNRLWMTMLCTFYILNIYIQILEIKKELTDILSTGIFHHHWH